MATEAIEMASDGDVILVVTKAQSTRRFRVSSGFLSKASEVFATMLSPKFLEGQALEASTGTVCEISLKDDDPDCMELVLNMIHMRHNKLPHQISTERLLDLAILIDKYFLHEVMQFPLDRWLKPTRHDDLHIFLRVAVLLNHAESFAETTRLMLLHQATSYSTETSTAIDESLFWMIFSIEQKREEIRSNTLQEIHSVAYIRNEGLCSYAQYISNKFLASLDDFNRTTSGLRKISLERAFHELLMALNMDTMIPKAVRCNHKYHYHPEISLLTQNFIEQLEIIRNFSGLCLDCEKRAQDGKQYGACQFGHSKWLW